MLELEASKRRQVTLEAATLTRGAAAAARRKAAAAVQAA